MRPHLVQKQWKVLFLDQRKEQAVHTLPQQVEARAALQGSHHQWASQEALVLKNPLVSAGDIKRRRFNPWVRMTP